MTTTKKIGWIFVSFMLLALDCHGHLEVMDFEDEEFEAAMELLNVNKMSKDFSVNGAKFLQGLGKGLTGVDLGDLTQCI